MNHRILRLRAETLVSLWDHLLNNNAVSEEAAFVFARCEAVEDDEIFTAIDWYSVPPQGFSYRSKYYIELSDETKADVIKKAHNLQALLVEFHSHLGPWPAEFSASDFSGFHDFVPHILWRLTGRPYVAVVTTPRQDFDGLVWSSTNSTPLQLDAIQTEQRTLRPTGLSLLALENKHDK